MSGGLFGNRRRRVVMSAIREFADDHGVEYIGTDEYDDLMNAVEGQVQAVINGEDFPDYQRRYVVKSAVRDMADDVERADSSDPEFCDVMMTVEGQVQTVLQHHGIPFQ